MGYTSNDQFMNFHIITIFPQMFDSYLRESIIGRAIKNKKIKVRFYNPLDFCESNKRADGRPYGGGPGMVLRPELFLKAFTQVARSFPHSFDRSRKLKVILLSPSGKKFDTSYAKATAPNYTDLVLISGRYEGIDARVEKVIKNLKFKIEKLSIGEYVLSGGELPAMVLIDSISRQIPGVLGKYESLEEERVSSSEVYTRPEILKWPLRGKESKTYRVPKVLLSGNHQKIEGWKRKA